MDYFKKLFKSKTFWVGLAQVVTALGLYFTGEQQLNEVLFGAGGVLMIVMRMVTTQSINDK
jgi:hypothetical protein